VDRFDYIHKLPLVFFRLALLVRAMALMTYADKMRVASDTQPSLPRWRRYHCISAGVGRSPPNKSLVIAGAVKAVRVILAH
jgi:hypothetical protein